MPDRFRRILKGRVIYINLVRKMSQKKYYVSAFVCIFSLFALTSNTLAKTASEIFESASPSIVEITCKPTNSLGSGVVIAKGIVATNCHVVENAEEAIVVYQDQYYSATPRHVNQDRDVCTLSVIDLTAPSVKIGSTKNLKVGAKVFAIGSPQGFRLTLSDGIISSLRPVGKSNYLQISAPISKGSSGGGLFDEQGYLIGLTTFYHDGGQQLNFAVPVEWIQILNATQTISSFPQSRSHQPRYTEWLHKAISLSDQNNWAGLATHAYSWVSFSPEEATAYFYLGLAYESLGRTEEALDVYLHTLRISPKAISAWHNLGTVYHKLGQWNNAIWAYQKALEISPYHLEALINLGGAYEQSYQFADAIFAYQTALTIEPNSFAAYHGLCTAYLRQNYLNEAINSCRLSLQLKPDNARAWHDLGYAYKLKGQLSKATEIYYHLQNMDPQVASHYLNNVILP